MVTRAKAVKSRKTPYPEFIEPMLCLLTDKPVQSTAYLYEIKWDGYRLIAYVNKKSVRLMTRGGKDYTSRYPIIVRALRQLNIVAVLDGEMVVFDNEQKPDFHAVQLYNGSDSDPIYYCVFDLLYLNGNTLFDIPLEERKKRLSDLVSGNEWLMLSESFEDGPGLFAEMQKRGWEGIVAKRKDSTYLPGKRVDSWLKIPTRKQQEFVIGGWVESSSTGRSFKSLLFGAYKDGEFRWVGRSGSGYKQKEMPGILERLKPLEITKTPFVNKVLDVGDAKIHYIKPQLVAFFEFADWTSTGRIRKPATFKGFRFDKNASQVLLEMPVRAPVSAGQAKKNSEPKSKKEKPVRETTSSYTKRKPAYLNASSAWKEVDKSWAGKEKMTFELENCSIELHNVDRVLWKDVTKAHLVMYYQRIAPYLLPYIQDRPQSLNLRLSGVTGKATFLKDMENRQPDCATLYTEKRKHHKDDKRDIIQYLVTNNLETLLFMIDVGCIDVNPWNARWQQPDEPDFVIIELDPTIPDHLEHGAVGIEIDNQGFKKAIQVAKAVKKVMDKYGIQGFPKTS
ncbi:non-homologous end-joining DNA ligase [Chitinophaga sp. B61]|uniref:DNA ligase (ATP) n=1 Tax=Chitinophaga rhizophila TaxID=2866212 RepID=A0ABS7G768_9BACT|nr:non-homologous end-joining DNA ligase [Chitinophaga rhizophila]MBW8683494.1 non-homologous end-joining DNA ligase [Chitinophaga rhizophila]